MHAADVLCGRDSAPSVTGPLASRDKRQKRTDALSEGRGHVKVGSFVIRRGEHVGHF